MRYISGNFMSATIENSLLDVFKQGTILTTHVFVYYLIGLLGVALITMVIAYFHVKKVHIMAKDNQARLESLVNVTNTAIWEYDIKTDSLQVSPYWSKMLGYHKGTFDKLDLDSYRILVHKEDWRKFERAFDTVKSNRDVLYNLEIRLKNYDGDYVWVKQIGNVVKRDSQNQPLTISGFQMDINDQKTIEGRIKSSERLMQYIIEHNNAAVAVHDTSMNYLFVSEQYLKQFNVEEKDIIGKNHYEVFPDIPDKWKKVHQETLKGKVFSNDRDPFLRTDGHTDWTRWETRPWYKEDGTIGGIIVYTEVINAQLELEEQLKAQAEALHTEKMNAEATLMSIGDAVISTDNKGIITGFNKMSEAITEWKAEDAIGTPFESVFVIINELTKEPFKSPVKRVLETNKRVELENHTILITKNNKHVYIEDSATPIEDQNGNLNGVVLVFRDVSEKVRLSQNLSIEKQRLSRVVESTADIIFEIDKDKRFISVYGRGLKKINHTAEDFLNKTVLEVFGKSGKQRDIAYSHALNGTTTTYQWDYKTKDNTLYFEATISPIFDEQDAIIGAVGITRDITEAKLKQKEIEFLSYYDHLTELHNRRYFAQAIAKYDSEQQYPLGIMMIDLNGLKILNDAYGHNIGDVALKKVSKVLKTNASETDVIARIGGDEFAIVVPLTNEAYLDDLKDAILNDIQKTEVENVTLSLAIGHALKKSHNEAISEIMKAAEDTMYKRKLSEGISARNNTIRAILKTLTDKYTEEKVHSERVSQICRKIGEALQLRSDEIAELEMAGLFHDIGKISIPDSILEKPAALTHEEYDIIKSHTENGYQILRAADEYSDLAIDALYHHEHYDGKGYPEGLKGDSIPLNSRIIAVADAYEAMTSNRPYRKALSREYALNELKKYAGTQFDPKIVDVFLKTIAETLENEKLKINNGKSH